MRFVCPLPRPWHEIYQCLKAAWEKTGRQGEPPPVPLILNGWIYSNEVAKHERWQDTITWARQNGLEHLIPNLADDQKYIVEELTSYAVGPLGGPMYLHWNFEVKKRPENAAIVIALERLKEHWSEVAGVKLAAHTEPLKFTGKRQRRLLVKASRAIQPPWGSWDQLIPGHERRTFTRLRQAVNGVIAPLAVDHIDFEISDV